MSANLQHIQDSQSSEHHALLFCSTPSKAFLAQLGKSLCPAQPSAASAFYIENPPSTLPADFIDKLAKQVHDVFPDFKRELISSVIFKNTLNGRLRTITMFLPIRTAVLLHGFKRKGWTTIVSILPPKTALPVRSVYSCL